MQLLGKTNIVRNVFVCGANCSDKAMRNVEKLAPIALLLQMLLVCMDGARAQRCNASRKLDYNFHRVR